MPADAPRWLLLLLLALVSPQSSPSEQVRAKPRLNGTFVALGNETALWPEGRWLLEFEAMATVGISFVIVHASAHGTSDSSSECPSGTYDAYFPVTESQQPLLGTQQGSAATLPCFKQTGATVVGGTLGAIARAARSAGLQLHLGLAYPFTHLWMYTDASRRAHLAQTQQSVARHLHRLYSDTVTIAGYYTALEES